MSDQAADATEYALMLSLIAVVIIASVELYGETLAGWYSSIIGRLPL